MKIGIIRTTGSILGIDHANVCVCTSDAFRPLIASHTYIRFDKTIL